VILLTPRTLIIDYFLLIILTSPPIRNNQLSLINNHFKATTCDRAISNGDRLPDSNQIINIFHKKNANKNYQPKNGVKNRKETKNF